MYPLSVEGKEFLQAFMLEILEEWDRELSTEELNRLASELTGEAFDFFTEGYDDPEDQEDLEEWY